MLRAIKAYAEENGILCHISPGRAYGVGIGARLGCACKTKEVDAHSNVHNKRVCATDRYSYLRRWRSDEYGSEYSRVEWKNPVTTASGTLDPEKNFQNL